MWPFTKQDNAFLGKEMSFGSILWMEEGKSTELLNFVIIVEIELID
jgi:hypothetical protein